MVIAPSKRRRPVPMVDVHKMNVARDIEDDAFHDANEVIVRSEIGGESDDGSARQFSSSSEK